MLTTLAGLKQFEVILEPQLWAVAVGLAPIVATLQRITQRGTQARPHKPCIFAAFNSVFLFESGVPCETTPRETEVTMYCHNRYIAKKVSKSHCCLVTGATIAQIITNVLARSGVQPKAAYARMSHI